MSAFSEALALESLPPELHALDVPKDTLVKYARTVAYKVFHNLMNGHEMVRADDPLTVNGVPAPQAWPDHYGDEVEAVTTH